ncbi:MAG: hypothetical protein AAB340_00365 [Patescibacteria group bacterium]
MLLTLNYHNQPIDLGGAYKVKIHDAKTGEWINYPTDFSRSKMFLIYEMCLPVVNRDELIGYKSIVARSTDLEDVRQMYNFPKGSPYYKKCHGKE